MLHVVGGDMGGGFEWRTAPAYRTTVRRGITAWSNDNVPDPGETLGFIDDTRQASER